MDGQGTVLGHPCRGRAARPSPRRGSGVGGGRHSACCAPRRQRTVLGSRAVGVEFRQKLRADWPADQTSGVPISPRQRGTTAPSHGQLARRQGGEPLPPAWGAPVRARTPRSRGRGRPVRRACTEMLCPSADGLPLCGRSFRKRAACARPEGPSTQRPRPRPVARNNGPGLIAKWCVVTKANRAGRRRPAGTPTELGSARLAEAGELRGERVRA